MDNAAFESCLENIEQVFEQEAEYIVRGQLLELGDVAKLKLEHLTVLNEAIESGSLRDQPAAIINRVRKLQVTATEHDRHLQAMRNGLSQMIDRMNRLQSDASVGSYDQYGTRVQFSGARGGFESKA